MNARGSVGPVSTEPKAGPIKQTEVEYSAQCIRIAESMCVCYLPSENGHGKACVFEVIK